MTVRYFIHKKGEQKIVSRTFKTMHDAKESLKKIRETFYLQEYSLGKEENGKKYFEVKET